MNLQFNPGEKKLPCFEIPYSLPSLNEYLSACNKHPQVGNSMKSKCTQDICWCIRKGIRGFHTDKKVIIHYHIYEKNIKRDKDNVFAMISKCTQDALQKMKVIDNDGWKNVENFTHDFFVDKNNPRVIVWLEVIEDE